ncbi:MAG TPA: prepilin-type N-terminal cleavage/methylation domain-containing protein [Pyrinomonadaceae bacterium]|jgi:prepilin-type N-terminal cleavage/methylation domain-containing protein|nr:prepilin-type N-terminal cleavage/methylation domain-containing protein [Pyrinomonadaceae bacterium]
MSSNYFKFKRVKRGDSNEDGFTLFEMVVAMLVLSIGLLGVASAISYALMASNRGRGVTNAKMLVVSALEQMETLRNTGQLNFQEISNSQVSGSTFRGFPSDFRDVSTVPGPDGVFGTADDLSTAPGPDGNYGTTDDVRDMTRARPGVYRQILVTDLNPLLKKITVTLRYGPNGNEVKELVGISYLNDDAHSNYIP